MKSRGFTLVELIVASLLGSILVMSILALIPGFLRSKTLTSQTYNLESVAATIFNDLTFSSAYSLMASVNSIPVPLICIVILKFLIFNF